MPWNGTISALTTTQRAIPMSRAGHGTHHGLALRNAIAVPNRPCTRMNGKTSLTTKGGEKPAFIIGNQKCSHDHPLNLSATIQLATPPTRATRRGKKTRGVGAISSLAAGAVNGFRATAA